MFDTILHRWLGVPYTLHVRHFTRRSAAKQTILLIHGLGDTGDLWKDLFDELPAGANIVAVDLLGFGDSPRPSWGVYDARTQARCLLATYLRIGLRSPIQIVGHSLGCLVAIDFAKRYPLLVRRLVLCAPPIYRQPEAKRHTDDMLRDIYTLAAKKPSFLVNMYDIGQKIRLLSPSLSVTKDNIEIFVRTLHASIINQRTVDDIAKVKVPITIIHGLFDPFVIRTNLVTIRKQYANVNLIDIPASHDISAPYRKAIISALADESVKEGVR